MALVTGGHLAAAARAAVTPADRRSAPDLLAEVADALAYAHLRGVIHRDIKPDNILLESGAAGARWSPTSASRARWRSGARLTATGIAVGTPTYMSPEQAVGERDIDGRSDIYSLGVVGYQMLTGRVPFEASNSMALLLKHVSERPRPIRELRPEAPRRSATRSSARSTKAPGRRGGRRRRRSATPSLRTAGRSHGERRARSRCAIRLRSRARAEQRRRHRAIPSPARVPGRPESIELEPPHLAWLTTEQRADLRLWRGRINLLDRVKVARAWAVGSVAMTFFGFAIVAAAGDVPPLALGP